VPSLQALVDSRHQIVAVYTQPDRPAGRGQQLSSTPVKSLALDRQLPIFQPENLSSLSEQEQLKNFSADLMVVVAYGLLLPKSVLAISPFGAINVHPSLLPQWRGAAPIQHAILAGDAQTGVSIIQLIPKMDAGPIIYQKAYPLSLEETSGSLHDKLAQQGAQALLAALDLLTPSGWQSQTQDENLATYTRKIAKSDAEIDWSQPAETLARAVRAYHPWPIAFSHFQGQTIRIHQAQALPSQTSLPPGTIAHISPGGIDISTGKGLLRLLMIQLPGSRALTAAEFLRGQGQKWQVEDRIGEQYEK